MLETIVGTFASWILFALLYFLWLKLRDIRAIRKAKEGWADAFREAQAKRKKSTPEDEH
jgi:hypothetical protein